VGSFEVPLSRLVTLHKDAGELRLTAVLAQLLRTAAGGWTEWAQAVVAVPASPAAVRRRGFDHGALLGAALAATSGVPALDALSARSRRDQRGLGASARARNATSAIRPVPGVAVPPRVLAIDDVFTTGATLDAAASALLEAGAREVRVLAVARACGGRL
jgi:predicted amidophosphoribosyltransferase